MRRAIALVGLALVLGILGAGTASAHAGFVSSDPADGSSLETSPEQIRISFTETPDLGLSSVLLLDAGGDEVPLGPLRAEPPRAIVADVPGSLPDGVYTVSWEVVSTEDGHKTAAAFAFAVGEAAAPTPGATPQRTLTRPSPGSIAAKSSLYAGLSLLIASGVVGLGIFGGAPRRLHVVGVAAAAAAFAGAAGLLVVEQRSLEVSMADLLRSDTGRPFVQLVVLTLAAAIAAVVAAARPGWRRALWVAAAAAAAAGWVRASGGHAAAAASPLPQELLQWIHILAMSVWIGGLVLLVLLLREPGPPPVPAIRRYSNLAVVAVAMLVASGVVRTISEVGGPGAIVDRFGTGYVTVLATKVALAAALIGLGAWNRRRSIPALAADARPLRRIVRVEIVVATGVVLLTAALTGLDPSEGAATAAPRTAAFGVASGTDFARTTEVELTTTPGTPGQNALRAVVRDPATDAILVPDTVALRFSSVTAPEVAPTEVTLEPNGDAWVGQDVVPSVAGTWEVVARVTTGADAVEVPMTLITRSDATSTPTVGAPFVTASFPSGVSVQVSVEDAAERVVLVHVIAIAPDASEIPIEGAVVVASAVGRDPVVVPSHVATAGHAIAQGELDPGAWTFDAVVTTKDERSFQATAVEVPLTDAPAASPAGPG